MKSDPAFPCVIRNRKFPNNESLERLEGMSLRDYFAAKSLDALIGRCFQTSEYNRIAEYAYGIADQMIIERNKHETTQSDTR